MNIRNMKVWICVACFASSLAAPAPRPYPLQLDIIDMAAISRMSPQQLEKLAEGLAAEEIMRTKRSSAQALTSVVSKASSGLQSKVGLLGQASAGITTLIASASSKSGHNDEHHGYSYEPHDEKYDYWGLKKSILYTLFQAVKAITGGVTILKGQLIKGGGALAATLGKVISVKGDAVSNLGKKIVSSAALSHKKPHSTAVYGPPPPAHVEYAPPSGYGAPTAPAAHYAHTGPSAPTGFAAHKYPAHLDELIVMSSVTGDRYSDPEPPPYPSQHLLEKYYDLVNEIWRSSSGRPDEDLLRPVADLIRRGKLNGLHAGVLLLTPLGEPSPSESHQAPTVGHTPLDPPPSIVHSVYSAIKNAFSSASPNYDDLSAAHHPPPPPQPVPPFKPMEWGALNSYGEPAMPDAYPDYDPRHPQPSFDYAASKKSIAPTAHAVHKGLTPDKIQKISRNLNKLAAYMNENVHRSSEDLPTFTGLDKYKEMLKKGQVPLFPTPVETDNEIGVLPAEFLPTIPTSTSTTTTTTTTTEKPVTTTEANRRKDAKFILRGNKIVQV